MKAGRQRRSLAAASVGNLCEIYDFAIFGFSIPFLSVHFFPQTDKASALLSVFAVYATAFVARPAGGLIFGMMADRIGRVAVLSLSIWLMALGTMSIGLLPTYETVGILSPILLVLCRSLQGLAMGGQTTGSSSFVLESAPSNMRGRWIGWTWFYGYSAQVGAAALILFLQGTLGIEFFSEWAWRLPFLLGGLIAIVGVWLRRNLEEPEEFRASLQSIEKPVALAEVAKRGRRSIGHVILLQSVLAVGANIMTAFLYPFLMREAGLPSTSALLANLIAILILAIMMPVSGALSDRFGRKPLLLAGAASTMVFAYPALMIASSGSFEAALAGQIILALAVGLYGGTAFTTMPELFPTSFRATGHALSYQTGTVIFGGTAPFVSEWLSRSFGPMAPGTYLACIGLVGIFAALLIPETNGRELRKNLN